MSEIWNEIARRVRARLVQEEQERTIKLIDEYAENTDYPEVEWTLENLKEAIKGEQK